MENEINNIEKITPFLWFDNNAEEAITFYSNIFKSVKIKNKAYYGETGPGIKGKLMTAVFELNGQEFIALNGGPNYKFTPAVSFVINCQTQEEVDHYWYKLSEGGRQDRCGWLQDPFGLSWQVVPKILGELMSSGNGEQSRRAMQAMMGMNKLDIAQLQQAYDGVPETNIVL